MIRLDEKQCLELEAADVSVDGRVMRVVIRAGRWHWTDYGGTERHHEDLSPGAVEFHAPFHSP